ncbi:adenylosuccinate lyase [Hyphomicrobiales bacterium]|jgi:adenylosuccinate lyase|nr:adenylosuccinate lyase [Rhodobiaceae bacterium]MBT5640581.1 adenylosuccinate lyase [Rhodobiaceae bacterium]MBT6223175.1 adenylosuccinate lyase [Rhodobiaceae bacterium]MDC0139281.1 adenylosuccinate lyase [Hyphomicrobiales bacterium]MDC3272674.1 adenylosuccinate lyase [Hyphomicrobiales bacterium]|tara:strand:+ start:2223 stop:3536 length:1314 start_codon:yes stop_codon:yes gene_type:complete
MIIRYSREEMVKNWSDENRFKIWFDIELFALEAMESIGSVESGTSKIIKEKSKDIVFNVNRINEIERETHHDVIAFLTHLSEIVGSKNARFIHQGMTSSDILDTCLSVQLSKAADLLINDLDVLLKNLKDKAYEFKLTPTIGRSHGIHAEPTTFGLKMAQAYAEFERAKERLIFAKKDISTCALSGSVGTFANIDPRVEEYVAKKLGLNYEPISTQVIPRDRHAMFFSTLGVIAGSLERLATEIRHLQRTEVGEVSEFFSKGQKGSSSMPHKRNPVLTENITGLSRIVRGMVNPALENIALWHERDISHSSVERVIGPDSTITLDFAINRLSNVIEKLVVYPDKMLTNINSLGGLIYSQRILLELTQKGISREESYALVQKNAAEAWDGDKTFKDLIMNDIDIKKVLKEEELTKLFSLNYHLSFVETIFERVFNGNN